MSKFKYFFLPLFSTLLLASCGGGAPRAPYYNPTLPHQPVSQPGHCFSALMSVADSRHYEIFLSESPQAFCGKTGGKLFVNKQVYAGTLSCGNWTAPPVVQLNFDLQFTKLQQLQIIPRGSGGFFVGNQGTSAITPVIFAADTAINPQNKDKGWNTRILPFTNPLNRGGVVELYCRHCDFNKNGDMSIQLKYRDREVGSFKINPKNTSQCNSTAAHTPLYPHAR